MNPLDARPFVNALSGLSMVALGVFVLTVRSGCTSLDVERAKGVEE